MSTSERRSAAYQACVARYLASPLGRSTPDSVAAKLMVLWGCAPGLPEQPSMARLHGTRAFLEAWELEEREEAAAEVSHAS